MRRRRFLHLLAGAAAVPAASPFASAQSYPARPVRILVGFAPGGAPDILARLLGQSLSERLGQPFIIENRPGAGSNIATDALVKSPPDGYTLMVVSPANSVNNSLYENLTFNFIRDTAPVAAIIQTPQVLAVHPSLPAKTIPELIAYAKANPGKINLGSPGIGTGPHVAAELFNMMAGISMLHVPYRGGGPALTALLAGEVQVYFPGTTASIEHVRAGKIRALAVTSAKRVDALSDTPPVSDFLPTYEANQWYGVCAPRNTPDAIVERLNREINAVLADQKIKAKLDELGGSPLPGSPVEFGKFIAAETEKWGKVVRAAKLKAE